METGDVLANDVQRRRPPRFEIRFVISAIADRGDVIEQRVEPDVDGKPLVKRYRNAPAFAGSRDVDVLEFGFNERDDFVAPAFRLYELRILVIKVQKPILELRQREEIARLATLDGRCLVNRTDTASFLNVGFRFK